MSKPLVAVAAGVFAALAIAAPASADHTVPGEGDGQWCQAEGQGRASFGPHYCPEEE